MEKRLRKQYYTVVKSFFYIEKIKYIGMNDFWLCPNCFQLNFKDVLYANKTTPFKWIEDLRKKKIGTWRKL